MGEYNQAETSSEVQVVLNKLTPKHRMALVLKEYQGMSCDEIGEVMGASRSAVKSLLFRAREEFRQAYLAKYGQTPYADDRVRVSAVKIVREVYLRRESNELALAKRSKY